VRVRKFSFTKDPPSVRRSNKNLADLRAQDDGSAVDTSVVSATRGRQIR